MLYILFYSKSSGAFSPELYPNIYYRTEDKLISTVLHLAEAVGFEPTSP